MSITKKKKVLTLNCQEHECGVEHVEITKIENYPEALDSFFIKIPGILRITQYDTRLYAAAQELYEALLEKGAEETIT